MSVLETMDQILREAFEAPMIAAYEAALVSPDPSTQNGATLVLLDGGSVTGCNQFPAGVSAKHWNGPKEAKYARVVHAEVSVLLKAARTGVSTHLATLVAPWAACSNCAKHIAYSGVIQLVRHKFTDNGVTTDNRWYEDCLVGDEIMREAGIEIVEIDPIPNTGIRLRRDGKLWEV